MKKVMLMVFAVALLSVNFVNAEEVSAPGEVANPDCQRIAQNADAGSNSDAAPAVIPQGQQGGGN